MLRQSLPTSFFRALGLSILTYAYPAIFAKRTRPSSDHEEKKVAISRHRGLAALRCCIHIVPIGVSVTLAYLNIHGYYIGGELAGPSGQDSAKLGGLQFAAKMHELSINASIAAMLLSYIRYELTMGIGLPFGALVAGQRFTEFSYLWSTDLWGAILSQTDSCSSRRKFSLVAAVVVAIIIAATAAPASAIAIIPRLDMYDCCGTSFWINASSEDLWPSRLDTSNIGGDECLGFQATTYAHCPSGGFSALLDYGPFLTDTSLNNVPPGLVGMSGDKRLRGMNVTWQIGRNPSLISAATVPMATIADALGMADWGLVAAKFATERHHRSSRYWYQRDFQTTVHAYQPATRVKCSNPFYRELNDTNDIAFYNQSGNAFILPGSSTILPVILRPNVNELPFSRIYWRQLPPEIYGNSTMGAVIILPTPPNATREAYLTCNIDSRWAEGTIFPCGSGMYCGSPTPAGSDTYNEYQFEHSLLNWEWQPVKADIDWVAAVNPPVTYRGNNVTAFAAIAYAAGIATNVENRNVIEGILAMMFTDALSRTKSEATLQGTLKGAGNDYGQRFPADGQWVDEWMSYGNAFEVDEGASRDWVPLRMKTQVNGYAYSFKGITIKLSITILMLHAVLALCHTVYEVGSGLSSSSWDSIVELVALAMNSTQTTTLMNTCAGITRIATMKLMVRIVTTKADHLELEFSSPSSMKSTSRTKGPQELLPNTASIFEPNTVYGAITSEASRSDEAESCRLRSTAVNSIKL
jgi:hypothetical protein